MLTETKPFGVIMGLLGNVMIAIAIAQLIGMDTTSPDLSGVWLLPLGIVVSTMAVFLGGGWGIFLTTFLAVGVGSLYAAFTTDDGSMQSFGYLFGGIFAAVPLLLGVLWFSLLGKSKTDASAAQNLVATGGRAVGTVVSVTDTGMTFNDNPRVQLVMRIQPDDGSPAFDGTKAVVVSRVAIPRAGDRFPVFYDRSNPTIWAYGAPGSETQAPAELQALLAR